MDNLAVVGAPGTENGTVLTYALEDGEWIRTASIESRRAGGQFGYSVDLVLDGMVVGAPGVFAPQTSTRVGAAFFYQYNSRSSRWTRVGPAMFGRGGLATVEESFGTSVARSGGFRVAVGAPNRTQGDGGVYTFELSQTSSGFDWLPLAINPIAFEGTGEELGRAVDLSRDGNLLLAGAPGANGDAGRFLVLEWTEAISDWTEIPVNVQSVAAGQRFGESATFLSDTGDVFAVGGPGAAGGGGLVRVYRLVNGAFEQLGPDIVGSDGAMYGAKGSLSGSSSMGVTLFVGTSTGIVKRFVYDESATSWNADPGDISTESSGFVTGVSSTPNSVNVAIGVSGDNLFSILSSQAPPTPAPVAPTTSPTLSPQPTLIASLPTGTPSVTSSSMVPEPTALPVPTGTPGGTLEPTASNVTVETLQPTLSVAEGWVLSAGPFVGSGDTIGSSVALEGNTMATGSRNGAGSVQMYALGSDGQWSLFQSIDGTQVDSLFGYSIDMSSSGLLVGAPGTFAEGTNIVTGAASFYVLSPGDGWTQLGPTIRGDTDAFSADEFFGFAVASSDNNVVVASAPFSNYDGVGQRGRVYTFEYDESTSTWPQRGDATPLVGEAASAFFGSAVDISADGAILVVGASSENDGAGGAYIYQWSGSAWSAVIGFSGDPSEALGGDVKVLSSDGRVVAAGGSGYDGGKGIIRIYQLSDFGSFVPLTPIVGNDGEQLGSPGTVSGAVVDGTLLVLASTRDGVVKTLAYDPSTSTWTEALPTVETGLSSPNLSGSTDPQSFVAGKSNQVLIYSL